MAFFLIAGMFTRCTALALSTTVVVAIVTVLAPKGFFLRKSIV